MRGATGHHSYHPIAQLISIHAPHARSDLVPPVILNKIIEFQSTLLMRGATLPPCQSRCTESISIHAPHARSDAAAPAAECDPRISIHAPHARSDDNRRIFKQLVSHFNPRSSCEERRFETDWPSWVIEFQSTLLMRGATATGGNVLRGKAFQSTLLMRGATACCRPASCS